MIKKYPSLLSMVAALAALFVIHGCSSSGAVKDVAIDQETLAVYDNKVVTLDEFESEYARTTGGVEAAADDSLSQWEDFLERYVNFKLKVLAARDAGIDQDPQISEEILNYQAQFARPYLLEQEVIEPLVRDLYEKQAHMVNARHILIRVPAGAAPADTAVAFAKMQGLVDSLNNGADFGELALRFSEDPSASNPSKGLGYKGDLGYFSGGRMVQEFEDHAFSTPVGETSPIFRTQYGYHILEVVDKKPAVPPIKLSHFMLTVDSTESDADVLAEITAIRDSILAGADFADLARELSDDTWSKERGGDIGMQSFDDRLLPALKDPAFELENVGDVTEPIRTDFGFHLIQLTERGSLPTYEESYEDLKKTALRLPRARQKEIEFGKASLARHGSWYDTTAIAGLFEEIPVDSLVDHFRTAPFDSTQNEMVIAGIKDSTYTVNHVVSTSNSRRFDRPTSVESFIDDLMTQFLIDRAIDYEVDLLEESDPEFRRTMHDFRDGLILFKFMEDSVWTAAAQDTASLKTLYDKNPSAYQFPERTELISYQGKNREQLSAILEELQTGVAYADLDSSLTTSLTGSIKVDTLVVTGPTNSVFDSALKLNTGEYAGPVEYNRGFVLIENNATLPPRQKTFEEAQSDLISEYQTILEDRVVSRLRKRYNVRTFPANLVGAYSDVENEPMTQAGN